MQYHTRPIFLARTFCLVEKKRALDLKGFSQISKAMKKVQ